MEKMVEAVLGIELYILSYSNMISVGIYKEFIHDLVEAGKNQS